jgi:hypothetical protein
MTLSATDTRQSPTAKFTAAAQMVRTAPYDDVQLAQFRSRVGPAMGIAVPLWVAIELLGYLRNLRGLG